MNTNKRISMCVCEEHLWVSLCVCLCVRGIQGFEYQSFFIGKQMSMSEVRDEHKCVCVFVCAYVYLSV